MAGVVLLALALTVTLSYFGFSGSLSNSITEASGYLFGKGSFFLPLTLFVMAFFVLVSEKKKILGSTFVGGMLLLLSLLGLMELAGQSSRAGGVVGYLFSWPWLHFFGFWGALIFFMAFLISAVLITFRIALKDQIKEKIIFKPNLEGEMVAERKLVLEKGLVTHMAMAVNKAKSIKPALKTGPPKPAPAEDTVTINSPASGPVLAGAQAGKRLAENPFGLNILPAAAGYKFPPLELLEDDGSLPVTGDIKSNAVIIQKTLENFGIPVEMSEVNIGPAVTQFTLRPATGVKLAQITALHKDLSLALAVHSLRIEAPIPGKSLVGIEIPNTRPMIVGLKSMLQAFEPGENKTFLNIALGKDVSGRPVWTTLTKMPHLLIAGATGSGKSIAINSMIVNFLFQHSPEILRFILIDPKRVELTLYNGIPHLLTPVIVEPKKVVSALKWAVAEMERRYEVLSGRSCRDIQAYNSQVNAKKGEELMPYIVVVIDELADLMAAYGHEIEGAVVRLAQMARAVGVHLVLATQRPSVEVITGLIKANITSRAAFAVVSHIDSRTILDSAGAEKLLGSGDMLFISADAAKPKRIQGTFVSDKEVKKVVNFVRSHQVEPVVEEESAVLSSAKTLEIKVSPLDLEKTAEAEELEDEFLPQAKEVIMQAGKASASLLQRRLKVGYARAARLLDILEAQGLIGPGEGAKPREVLVGVSSASENTLVGEPRFEKPLDS